MVVITHTPTLTGGGASGTWGISIGGGLANNAPQLAASYENNEIVVDATSGVNSINHNIKFRWYTNYYRLGIIRGGSTDAKGFTIWEGNAGELLLVNLNAAYYRGYELARVNGNVASATQLQTARTIWGQSFNGTANVDGRIINTGGINVRIGSTDEMPQATIFSAGTYPLVMYNPSGIANTRKYYFSGGTNYLNFSSMNDANSWVSNIVSYYHTGEVTWHKAATFSSTVTINENITGKKALILSGDVVGSGRLYTSFLANVSDTWTSVLKTQATYAITGDTYVAANTSQLILGWKNLITSVGYRTTYCIGSTRGTSGFGEMRLWVGNNDAQTDGRYLSLGGNGTAMWSGSSIESHGLFTSVSNGIVSRFGAQNGSYCHIYTTAPSFYMDKGLSADKITSRTTFNVGNSQFGGSYIELYGSTPYIDFHFNNSTADYTSRIIEIASGTLAIYGRLETNSNITAAGEITAYSDIRLKSNISDLNYRGRLKPKSYTKDSKRSIGFIALEVLLLYPELVMIGQDENHYLSLNYGNITAVLSVLLNLVEDRVLYLENRVSKLENVIVNLGGKVPS